MEILERIWELLGVFFGGLAKAVEQGLTSIFGSANARKVKRLGAKVEEVAALEPKFEALSDEDLRAKTDEFRARLAKGETLDDIMVEAFAVAREAGKRYLDMRHYDVQILGGMVLHSGWIAEMVTGEGKTLVATLPAYLNALEGKGVHVITVNDYLARRDMEWMGPLYIGLGLKVGAIQSDMPVDQRQKAYACDITYGTNNEFGFDYLRDNMRPAARGDDHYAKRFQQSQGPLNYAIIDEVDNILIDEARTPLIISGPASQNVSQYAEADSLARKLKKGEHFEVNEKDHTVNLTDLGVREAEKLAGVESFYTAGNMHWPHLIDNALKAHFLYELDVRYVVEEGRVIIVDEFTGRKMEGRQWSDGLHQAVEAKEGVKIKEETQTLATITLQNFFKLYKKLCGMTGTAMTEAGEFWKIYQLDVVAIPTNREMKRLEFPDRIYSSEEEKWLAVAKDVERVHKWDVLILKDDTELWGEIVKETEDAIEFREKGSKQKDTIPRSKIDEIEYKGRPVLVGTTSIEKSERLSALLERRGIAHSVLNAKHHKREAEIVAQAGRHGAVTLATNMAGRGTDIVLGGNPETMAWARLQDKYETRLDVPREEWDALVDEIETAEGMKEQGKVLKELGGLCVMGTERHESRRIDLQLRGRTGRQGDPGSSRFYLSLEDDLMRIFAGPWAQKIMKTLGLPEGEPIESRMVTRRIEAAQKKVEERNFEIRKNLLEYDEVMDEQRKRVYSYRQKILDGFDCKELILEMIEEQMDYHLSMFLERNYGVETFASWAGTRLSTELEPRDFRGMDIRAAQDYAIDEAERAAETYVIDALEESLNLDEDPADWNWESLVKGINARWNLSLRDRDLKKVGREGVAELVIEQARKSLESFDLSEGAPYLEEDYGLKTALGWLRNKFGIEIAYERVAEADLAEIKQLALEQAETAYAVKETEYPVMAGLYRYSEQVGGGQSRLDRSQLIAWARQRFDVQLEDEVVKNKQRDELRQLLLEQSEAHRQRAHAILEEVEQKVDSLYGGASPETTVRDLSANGAVTSLSKWVEDSLHSELPPERIEDLDREHLEQKLRAVVDEHYRPEMRRMERSLLLQIVDAAWKDHLLAMDHLRSAVGLVGYAQVDPKVEYKREGMKLFEQVWNSIGQRVTDLIFRMEQLDERFVGSTWVESKAVHEEAQSTSEIARQQQAAIDNMQGGEDKKIQPIRRGGERVGRNEPCPCGSGKKYKNCCMRDNGGS